MDEWNDLTKVVKEKTDEAVILLDEYIQKLSDDKKE